jgi:hypothetical protein
VDFATFLRSLQELVSPTDRLDLRLTPNTSVLKVVDLGSKSALVVLLLKFVFLAIFVLARCVLALFNQTVKEKHVVARVVPLLEVGALVNETLVRSRMEGRFRVLTFFGFNNLLLGLVFLGPHSFFPLENFHDIGGVRSTITSDLTALRCDLFAVLARKLLTLVAQAWLFLWFGLGSTGLAL